MAIKPRSPIKPRSLDYGVSARVAVWFPNIDPGWLDVVYSERAGARDLGQKKLWRCVPRTVR